MKKYFLILCMAILPMAILTSCDDDDEDPPKPILADSAVGNYKADLVVTKTNPEEGEPTDDIPLDGFAFELKKISDAKVKMVVNEFTFDQLTIDFSDIELPLTGEENTLNIDIKDVVFEATFGENTDPNAKLSLKATIKNKKTITFSAITLKIDNDEYSITGEGEKETNVPL